MSDSTPAPPDEAADDGMAELQRQVKTAQADLRRLRGQQHADADRLRTGLGVILRSTGALSAVTMLCGLLMKIFVPVSGEEDSLTLFQALDPETDADVVEDDSSWGTGAGWFIPIAMVLLCAVLVMTVTAGTTTNSRNGTLITITEVFCWCLAIGCVLGFLVLAGLPKAVAVPAGLLVILLGGVLGIVTARLARVYRD